MNIFRSLWRGNIRNSTSKGFCSDLGRAAPPSSFWIIYASKIVLILRLGFRLIHRPGSEALEFCRR
ncbi:hypothetical protein DsansV1_C09g0096601 [Dioscorea sansibarensis]